MVILTRATKTTPAVSASREGRQTKSFLMSIVTRINAKSTPQPDFISPKHFVLPPHVLLVCCFYSISWQDNNLYLQHVDMTDYSDITQYQKDTITQILPSQERYEFLPPSAQKTTHIHRQEETDKHTHTSVLLAVARSANRGNRCLCPSGAAAAERHTLNQKVI